MKHKYYDLIMAWAGGADVEGSHDGANWVFDEAPRWDWFKFYRVKPKPNNEFTAGVFVSSSGSLFVNCIAKTPNIKLTFDGETDELLKVEKI